MKSNLGRSIVISILSFSGLSASAQPLNQVTCKSEASAEKVVLVLDGDPGASTGKADISFFSPGEPKLFLYGTFENGYQMAHTPFSTRVPQDNLYLNVVGKSLQTHYSGPKSVALHLLSSFGEENYSGTSELKSKSGNVLKQLNVTCVSKSLVVPAPTPSSLPFPPHHCGRCAF